MRCYKQFVLAALFGLMAPAIAEQPETGGEKIEKFHVMPGYCVVKSKDMCEARFQFYWRLARPDEACIYLHNSEQAVYCSPRLASGEVTLDLSVGQTTRFTLSLKGSPEHSVAQNVKVLTMGRDLRLRRRHLWSFL